MVWRRKAKLMCGLAVLSSRMQAKFMQKGEYDPSLKKKKTAKKKKKGKGQEK